jgi:hypothetical protein
MWVRRYVKNYDGRPGKFYDISWSANHAREKVIHEKTVDEK